jgi:hypothetical protein
MFPEQKKTTFALYNISTLVYITEVEGVYSAVRTESLYNRDTVSSSKTHYTPLLSSFSVTYTNDFILLDLINRIILGEEHKLHSSSL